MTKKIFSKPQAVIGLVLIVIVVICAIFAPVIAPNSPDQIDPSLKYLKADWDYPLGTDQLGRCELSRLIYGARYAIGMSIPMLLILGILGLIIGTFSVCAGEKMDRIITFICDVFISFPSLITAIAVKRYTEYCCCCRDFYVGLVCKNGSFICHNRNGQRVYYSSKNKWLQHGKSDIQTPYTEHSSTVHRLYEYGSCFCNHNDIELFISWSWTSTGNCRMGGNDE